MELVERKVREEAHQQIEEEIRQLRKQLRELQKQVAAVELPPPSQEEEEDDIPFDSKDSDPLAGF